MGFSARTVGVRVVSHGQSQPSKPPEAESRSHRDPPGPLERAARKGHRMSRWWNRSSDQNILFVRGRLWRPDVMAAGGTRVLMVETENQTLKCFPSRRAERPKGVGLFLGFYLCIPRMILKFGQVSRSLGVGEHVSQRGGVGGRREIGGLKLRIKCILAIWQVTDTPLWENTTAKLRPPLSQAGAITTLRRFPSALQGAESIIVSY